MSIRSSWRAPIDSSGAIGAWQSMNDLPGAVSHGALVCFGPFLYSLLRADPALTADHRTLLRLL